MSTSHDRSAELFSQAQNLFPGGVNSPVRAFKAVGGSPIFLKRGSGAYVFDADGNRYVDFLGSWGPLILGHADPDITQAIMAAAQDGTTFGASTEREIHLGETIRCAFPSMERLRFVSSGTEATMSALRAARGFTGRHKIIKIDGGYHGHADLLLAAAGSGVATLGLPGSAGVPPAAVADTLIVPFHDVPAIEAVLKAHAGSVAALIVEPVPGNMGLIPPKPGYLQSLRMLCDEAKVLLIFDEVISGFRVARGGAQERFGVRPDMTCLGKIIGAGLPLGAYGGRKEIMQMIAPEGPVYQAGTLSGNPLAMAAGSAMLRKLDSALYDHLERLGARLESGLVKVISDTKSTACVQRIGSAFTLFFCAGPVLDFTGAKLANTNNYATFFHKMLQQGFYLPPAQLETAFISAAHGNEEIDTFVTAAHAVLAATADLR